MGTGETSQVTTALKEGTSSQCGWNYQLCRKTCRETLVLCHQSRKNPHDLRTHVAKNA
ncbi:hypothetical protein ID866_9230 [Astraeus odoratus]|nr:hypothetical protein ID866_9230 [Astraeus odoratus]